MTLEKIHKFWFEEEVNLNIKFFRLAFLPTALTFYLLRFFDSLFLYSADYSVIQKNDVTLFLPNEVGSLLLKLIPSTYFSYWFFLIVFLLFLVIGILGLLPRILYLIPLILHTAFCLRNPLVLYGADSLVSLGFVFLILSGSGKSLSSSSSLKDFRLSLSSVGVRLMQIQISVIYFSTAFEKIKSDSWFQGEALWHVLNNKQMMLIDLSSLLNSSILISGLTWSVIVIEFFLAFSLWFPKTKKASLLLGVSFHLLIALLMGLWFFSLFMLCFYVLFIDKDLLKFSFKQLGLK